MSMAEVLDIVLADAGPDEYAAVPVPRAYRATIVCRHDSAMFAG